MIKKIFITELSTHPKWKEERKLFLYAIPFHFEKYLQSKWVREGRKEGNEFANTKRFSLHYVQRFPFTVFSIFLLYTIQWYSWFYHYFHFKLSIENFPHRYCFFLFPLLMLLLEISKKIHTDEWLAECSERITIIIIYISIFYLRLIELPINNKYVYKK